MKKLFALLLALVMIFALVACGNGGTTDSTGSTDSVGSTDSTADSVPSGTMTQLVTVNLLGNDIPVTLVRNFDNGAFRIDYQFNGNDVFAEGYVLEDGTWEISDTNNDFTFGTIEAVIPAIDDSAWAAADEELIVVIPDSDPEDSTDPVDPDPVDPNAESVAQTVTVDMMGNSVDVYVVKTGDAFEMSYSSFGNDVVLTGTIADGEWTMVTASPEEVANFAGNIVASVAAAIDENAWAPVVETPVAQTVAVEMMGNSVDVYVVKTGNAFEMSYSSFGNDVVLTGTIADGEWTMVTASPEEVANFAGNIVASVSAAIDENAWAPVVETPVAQTVAVEMMGNSVDVYVVKTGNAFEMSYSSFGNDVVLTGTIADGEWTLVTASPEEVANFAGNIVASVAAAIDEAAWAPVE